MTFQPTEEQQSCIDAAGSGPSVMINALAGCAKTTTLVAMAQRVRAPGLALVFNKKNQLEMQGKFPGNFKCQTMNGLGFGALQRGRPQVNKWDIDGGKLGKIVTQLSKEQKLELSSDQWDATRRLVSKAMLMGIVPGDGGTPLTPDEPENWLALADDLFIMEEDQEMIYRLARDVLTENNYLTERGVISFDDQVYAPTVLGGKWPQYPFIATDESQDLNALNHKMVELCLRPADGRLVVVGDPKQSIYGFRGAVSDSMGQMRGLRGSWTSLPLATTFRCPKSIVARQQAHAPGFTAWHTNPDGQFLRLPNAPQVEGVRLESPEDWGWTFRDIEKLARNSGMPNPSIGFVCRNNGPLMSLAFKLLRSGIGISMLGRDIGKGLIALSRKIAPEDGTPRDTTAGLVSDWYEREASLARANRQEEKVAGLSDRAECLQAALQNAGVNDAGGMRKALELLFARDSGRADLGTGHRFKGLERTVIVHLDPWRVPSKFAREALVNGDPRQMEQERNLKYVIETRARHTLVEANLEDFYVE